LWNVKPTFYMRLGRDRPPYDVDFNFSEACS